MKPYVIYYLHFKDEDLRIPNWNTKGDFVACVMAEDMEIAINKVKAFTCGFIKIMGVGMGKPEWVNENGPMDNGEIMPLGGWKRAETNK